MALGERIRRQLRIDAARFVDFASDLIRIPTENPPGAAYPRCATRIAAELRRSGLATRTIRLHRDAPCAIGTFGSGKPALYLSGHYDVVPAQDRTQFEPRVRNGHLHGRGSADMNGGITAMVLAVRTLRKVGFEPVGRIVCISVPDEETSGPRGTVALVKAGVIERDAIGMLTMEPTSGVVWNANRGVLTMRVTVRGRPAHVGLHFRGVNAFRGMLDIASAMGRLADQVAKRRTGFAIDPDAARRSVLLMGGEISGGHNFNVVPDRASFTVDRRINPEEDLETERARLLDVVERARSRGWDVEVEELQRGRSASTSEDEPLARALSASIREVTGRPARFELCPGVLETRHYAALGIPALAYGPGLLDVAHGPRERVALRRLLECAEVYARTAVRLLSARRAPSAPGRGARATAGARAPTSHAR